MRIRYSVFVLVAVLLAGIAACSKSEQAASVEPQKAPPESAQPKLVSAKEKRRIAREQFTPVEQIGRLSVPVRQLLHVDTIPMAEPGGPFEAGDVVTPQNRDVPRRRLIQAAFSKNFCIVHYEFGGYVHGYTIDVFALDNDRARYVGTVSTNRPLRSVDELKQAIASSNAQGYSAM
jgi:hypothetical protein